MKSTKHKNRNFRTDPISDKVGPDNYIPSYTQPKGITVTCHLHNPPLHFKTLADAQKHDAEWHDYRKVRVL